VAHNVICALTQYGVIVSTSYLGGNVWAHQQLFGYQLSATATPVA